MEEAKKVFDELTHKKIHLISKIPNGLNNNIYNINDAYILRMRIDNADPFYNIKNEQEVIEKIKPLKISENVISFDTHNATKLSKFLHGTHLYIDHPSMEQIRYVAKTLKKLHKSNIVVDTDFLMFKRLMKYKSFSHERQIPLIYEKKVVREIQKIFAKEEKVLCHNDLVHGNLLFKFDRVLLIDWEYASMNHPYFDLASFISENDIIDEEEIDVFLKTYFGSTYNSLKKRRVMLFVQFEDILWHYWARWMYEIRQDQIYQTVANTKLKRILTSVAKSNKK